MSHKDRNLKEIHTRVLTPEDVKMALENLPSNYIKLVLAVLEEQKDAGEIKKIYTKSYVSKVRNSQDGAFNEEVMNAIVKVGLEHLRLRNLFGSKSKKNSKTKKTSKTN